MAVLGQSPNMNMVMGSVLSNSENDDSEGEREKCLKHLCLMYECQNLPGKNISVFFFLTKFLTKNCYLL